MTTCEDYFELTINGISIKNLDTGDSRFRMGSGVIEYVPNTKISRYFEFKKFIQEFLGITLMAYYFDSDDEEDNSSDFKFPKWLDEKEKILEYRISNTEEFTKIQTTVKHGGVQYDLIIKHICEITPKTELCRFRI